MHALTLARQRIRARLDSPTTPTPVRLAHGLVEKGRPQYLPVLSSALAQDLLERGYDARTLERVYANRAGGDLGPVSRVMDRVVLNLPVHAALRERLQAFQGEICAAAVLGARQEGISTFRILNAPCGLAPELMAVAERLRGRHSPVLARLHCWGVDPDPDNRILAEAARRTAAVGLRMEFIREDLRRRRSVAALMQQAGPFHLICCPGLTQAFPGRDTQELVHFYAGLLQPGGTLLLDRWQPAEKHRLDRGLGVGMRYLSRQDLRALLEGAGLQVEREHATGEGGCVVTMARRPAP
ncbi:MAG: class I SAM-dependent methyltransferase [Armatimonadetes bacterium]|nr:class I SAM-dependent methyltransferase [Armatimonadota bacterium]